MITGLQVAFTLAPGGGGSISKDLLLSLGPTGPSLRLLELLPLRRVPKVPVFRGCFLACCARAPLSSLFPVILGVSDRTALAEAPRVTDSTILHFRFLGFGLWLLAIATGTELEGSPSLQKGWWLLGLGCGKIGNGGGSRDGGLDVRRGFGPPGFGRAIEVDVNDRCSVRATYEA